jgi:hypothetical protein
MADDSALGHEPKGRGQRTALLLLADDPPGTKKHLRVEAKFSARCAVYSVFRAFMGSTEAACLAGSRAASNAATSRTTTLTETAAGSTDLVS